jgi:uncharacterized protein YdeI (YjbR/CyaY-like superfamily)
VRSIAVVPTIPPELAAAFEQRLELAALPPSHQRQCTRRIESAKKPATKAVRVERALTMIAGGSD